MADYENEYAVSSIGLIATAEAIRAKLGATVKIPWSNETGFANMVKAISTMDTIIGFTGLASMTGVLTLTDDAKGLDSYTKSTSGGYVSVSNPLDYMFPYNQIEEFTDEYGNIFVKFPKFWMKWVTNASGVIDGWKISPVKQDKDYFIPDAFLKPDGSGEYNDYFALGKYEMSGSSSKGYSKSGQTCYVGCTRENARSAARAYGDADNSYNGYQQEDISMLTVYNFLCMMYYRTANIQRVYGGRTGLLNSWTLPAQTGTCDGVNGLNGWNASTNCVKMLGIENPYGNIIKWIDGAFFNGTAVYIHRYPTLYADAAKDATALGFPRATSNGWVAALKHGTTEATKSCVYVTEVTAPEAVTSGVFSDDFSYYADDSGDSGQVLRSGGAWETDYKAGLWYLRGDTMITDIANHTGARLCYRPIEDSLKNG